jgi:hypothetical protein
MQLVAYGPRLGGANELGTDGLNRDCYYCGPRSLCRNPDSQRLRLLGYGGRLSCVGWRSLQIRGRVTNGLGIYRTSRDIYCCDHWGLHRNPDSQRLRLLGYGSRYLLQIAFTGGLRRKKLNK